MSREPCPPPEALLAFANGDLSESRLDGLERASPVLSVLPATACRARPGDRPDRRRAPPRDSGRLRRFDLGRTNPHGIAGARLDRDVTGATGRVPDHPRDRPWGDGNRLRGVSGLAQPPRGPEDVARARRPGPVPPRGQGGRAAAPYEHRAGLRRRRARGPALLRDAVHRRPGARRLAEERRSRPASGRMASPRRRSITARRHGLAFRLPKPWPTRMPRA